MTKESRISFQTEIFVYPVIALLCFLSIFYLPVFGVFIGLFTPLPIILLRLRWNAKNSIIAILSTAGIILFIGGVLSSLVFLAEFGIVGLIIAESLEWKFPPGKTIFAAVLASQTLIALLLGIYFLSSHQNPAEFIDAHLDKNITETMEIYQKMEADDEKLEVLEDSFQQVRGFLKKSFPSLVIVWSIIISFLNFFLARLILIKKGQKELEAQSLCLWSANEMLIWGVIVSGGLFLIGHEPLGTIGLNVLIIVLAVYFFQGIAIVVFFFQKWNISVFLQVLGYLFILIQPFFLLGVVGLGLFDIWADFRKIKLEKEKADKT